MNYFDNFLYCSFHFKHLNTVNFQKHIDKEELDLGELEWLVEGKKQWHLKP